MQVILLEKVPNLGSLGSSVKVKPGYARNFLIPQGKAVVATPENMTTFQARRAELEGQERESFSAAETRAATLTDVSVSIARKAGDEGRLFGSVSAADIAEALTAIGLEVRKQEVRIAEPIRQLGEHTVNLHLHADVDATVTVAVIAEV